MTATVATRAASGRHRPVAVRSRGSKLIGATVSALGTLLVVLAGVVLLGMTVGPRVLHYRTATMLTGSMVPTINPGDVIVDVEEPVTDLKVGQIISYHIPVDDHRVESHRVSWAHINKDGSVSFRTKGDANNGADPWTARSAAGSSVWIVKTVLPVVGDVIRFMRQPPVQIALTRVVPAILIVSALFAIWGPSRRKTAGAA
jgi:signal peptidase